MPEPLTAPAAGLPDITPEGVRAALREGLEIALVDVREEDPFAQAHPLFAVQLSAGKLALEAAWRLPRRDVTIAVYDDGEGLAEPAARRLQAWGYSRVHLLTRDARGSGLGAWRDSGGELFRDVNVPSKAFGELVEHERHTPSLAAQEVKALIESGANVRVLDVRRFDEFHTMSIPSGTSVPGGELVLRLRELVPDPHTQVVVNCAGRTRSIIGTQSLVNAGVPNPVAALRNGTIGWLLAGQALAHGESRRGAPDQPDVPPSPAGRAEARRAAQALADRAGARRIDAAGLQAWLADQRRTLYRWDVRTPEEYAAGHLAGFGSAPGGQLVQETDVFAAVRGARIVLADGGPHSDGVRAPITAHWLAQMGWEVAWLADAGGAPGEQGGLATEAGAWVAETLPVQPDEQALLGARARRYRRPYEGTDAPREAMQAYLDWEFGLVAQLGRDGTHGFKVLGPSPDTPTHSSTPTPA